MATAVLPATAQELRSTYFMETSNYRHEMNPALLDAPYMSVPLVLDERPPTRFWPLTISVSLDRESQ